MSSLIPGRGPQSPKHLPAARDAVFPQSLTGQLGLDVGQLWEFLIGDIDPSRAAVSAHSRGRVTGERDEPAIEPGRHRFPDTHARMATRKCVEHFGGYDTDEAAQMRSGSLLSGERNVTSRCREIEMRLNIRLRMIPGEEGKKRRFA